MKTKQARFNAITVTVGKIKECLSHGVTTDSLNAAKKVLIELAENEALFPRTDFPIPEGGKIDRTFLVYEENDGSHALYVNSSLPGQSSWPHDHGGTWAIIAAVSGQETHRVFKALASNSDNEACNIEQVGEVLVEPGNAISLLPDGIHSIHATSDAPLLHLHLYGVSYSMQGKRKEYDLTKNKVKGFVLDDLGFIEDAR